MIRGGGITTIFTVNFNDSKVTKDFYQSLRDVYIEYQSNTGDFVRGYIYSPKYFDYSILFETLKIRLYRTEAGTVRIGLNQLWKDNENTKEKRDILVRKEYSKFRKKRIHPKRIIFESMWGSKYSCNPQALYEYIDQNYPEYECIWSLNDARTPIKGNGRRVRRGSLEYYRYLATAKYFVNNVNFETGYVKRQGQIEIQTMHGTPLKTLGLDVVSDFPTEEARRQFIIKNKRWDYLIAQGRFVEQKAESMFDFTNQILKTGYPRTDKLFKMSDSEKIRIKKALELPLDRKIILYAPTWRIRKQFDMQMNLERMKEALSDKYVLLIKLHHLSLGEYRVPEDRQFIFDMNFYQYIEDLYCISDLLITDYSSVMFDYALLNKPMIFFVYDIEEYAEQLRGMYVDFKAEAPGPLVYTTDEIIGIIENIDSIKEVYSKKINDFKNKYLTYECENSCEQIVQKVFKRNRLFKFINELKIGHAKEGR